MSYPPFQGGYSPYPPNDGGQGNIGFSSNPQSGPGVGFSYPQHGSGFPCPPAAPAPPSAYPNLNSSAPMSSLPYSIYPPASNASSNFSAPFSQSFQPTTTSAPYPPNSNFAPYPPQYNASSSFAPLPPANASYPPAASSAFYPNAPLTNAPYAPSSTTSPYPPTQFSGSNIPPPSQGYQNFSQNQTVPNPHNVTFYGASSQSGTSKANTPMQNTSGSMWPYQERPTVRPAASFDPSTDAAQLRKAMKGFGTDEATLIQILGRRTSVQRQQILQRYQQSFGRDLMKDLKSELSGQFEVTVVALLIPLPTYLAKELNEAISGIGTNERTLIEILCTNDNNTLRNIKAEYQKFYGKPLEADLKGDTSGDFSRLMVSMAAAFRDETGNDPSLAPKLAQSLYNAGAKRMGTNEAEFNRIMSSYSYPLLRRVFQEYRNVSGGKTFESAIQSELSGDFRQGLLAIFECINNRAAFYAHYLQQSMSGLGTKDKSLIRIIVSRCEIDMGNIKDEYRKAYGKRLEDAVTSETSGDYRKILLALIQG